MLYTTPPNQDLKPLITIELKQEEPKPEPIKITVAEGDTLESIAKAHNVTVQRLFNANPDIENPDLIKPAQVILVPLNTTVLADRPLPSSIISTPDYTSSPAVSNGYTTNSGNFSWGWCTWLADQLRPDIHATGNARDWIRYSNSKVPAVGAIAVNTSGLGHVAYVVDISPTQILVRHMNWKGFGKESTDWIDRTYWAGYIL